MIKKQIIIYTDGACSGNPGPGGYGAVLMYEGHRKEISGGDKLTTNNKMELLAAIQALNLLKESCCVNLYSDSAYLVNAFNQNWVKKWLSNGWLTSKKEPVENKDLWEQLWQLNNIHQITWHKVKGHAGNWENERCDQLAREAISKL